jgi:hypothetical protein
LVKKALFALVAASFVGAVARADSEWQVCARKEGVVLEKKAVEGSSFYEYRARSHITAAPAHALERIWAGVLDDHPPSVAKRIIVRHTDEEIVVYDQIHTPVVSDRDVTTRLRKLIDTRAGVFEIQFDTANELGPPPDAHHVRLPVVRGSWRLETDPAGGANIVYRCYSEPGGRVPAFLVRGAQQENLLKEFERVLVRIGH